MNLFILDKDENLIDSLSGNAENSACHFFNAIVTKEVNKGCQLTFEVDMTDERITDVIKEEHFVVFNDGDKFRLVTIKEITDIHGEDFIKEVYCDDSSIELYDEVILEEMRTDVSLELVDAMNHVLKNTRWTVGEAEDVNRIRLQAEYKTKTVLEGLNLIASAYGVEVDFAVEFLGNKIVSRTVTMKRQLGRNLGKRIEYKKDMESIKRVTNTGDIKTAVIPFGKLNEETGEYVTIKDVVWTKAKNGLDKPVGQIYLEDPDATESWGYKDKSGGKRPRWIAIEYSDIEDPNELIKYANMQLASHKIPKITYEVEALDLYKLLDDEDYSFETVEIGDTVAIIDHEFNPPLAITSRVVKIEENYSKTQTERKITLGNTVGSIIDKDLKTQVAELGGSVKVDLSSIYNRLENLQNSTNTSINELNKQLDELLNRPDTDLSDIYEWLERLEGRDDIDKDQLFQWIEQIETSMGVDLSEIRKKVESLQNNVTNLDKKTGTGVWSAISQVNQLLFGSASGYHYMSESDGIWVYDKPADQQPTKALVMKGGQLGIAKWDAQKRAWTVGTFIDGNMVNASMINTGTLSADRIKAGSISAEKLEVSVKDKIANSVTNEQVESKLQTNAEQIKAEVSKTYETKQAVTDKINNIQIGGVNRVLGTGTAKEFTFNGTTNNTWEPYNISKDISDKEVIVAFDFETEDLVYNTNAELRFQSSYTSSSSNSTVWQPSYTLTNIIKAGTGSGSVKFTTTFTNMKSDAKFRFRADNVVGKLKIKNVRILTGNKLLDWTPAPEDVEESVKGVKGELALFEETVNTTFKDGVIQQAEATAIKQHIQTVDTVKAEIDKEYNAIYKNSALSQALKNELSTTKTAFNNAHTSLKSFINTAIEDGAITDTERNSVNSAFTTYNNAVATYREKVQQCLDYISTAKVDNIQIGGRNLYMRTKIITGSDWYNIGNWGTTQTINGFTIFKRTGAWQGLSQAVTFEEGKQYTLSVNVKGDGNSKLHFYSNGGVSNVTRSFTDGMIAPTGWTRVSVTFTVGSGFDRPRFENSVDGATLELYAFQLERGTKPTDWTPAPEDIDAEFENYFTAEQINESLQGLVDQSNELADKYQNMLSDKVVTPNEKIQLKAQLEQITSKYENAKILVDAVNNPTLTNNFNDMKSSYETVKATIEPLLTDMTSMTETNESIVYEQISDFYEKHEVVIRLVQTALNSTVVSVKTEVTQMADGVSTAIINSEEALGVTRTVGKHFTFTNDGWVQIYASKNGQKGRFLTQISDSRLSFYDAETEVAYLSNEELYITDARIINTLHVGNMALEKSAKGGMIFKWKG